jgi:hypothetical protein
MCLSIVLLVNDQNHHNFQSSMPLYNPQIQQYVGNMEFSQHMNPPHSVMDAEQHVNRNSVSVGNNNNNNNNSGNSFSSSYPQGKATR